MRQPDILRLNSGPRVSQVSCEEEVEKVCCECQLDLNGYSKAIIG